MVGWNGLLLFYDTMHSAYGVCLLDSQFNDFCRGPLDTCKCSARERREMNMLVNSDVDLEVNEGGECRRSLRCSRALISIYLLHATPDSSSSSSSALHQTSRTISSAKASFFNFNGCDRSEQATPIPPPSSCERLPHSTTTQTLL